MSFPDRAQLDPYGHVIYTDDQPEATRAGDARNRALRTFCQGLAFDLVTAVVLLLLPALSGDWSQLEWRILAVSLAKTAAITALSFVMRYFKIVPKTL